MATQTTHVNELSDAQVSALQKAATGLLNADEAGDLETLHLVQINGSEVSLTEEGQATLRTLVDQDHPLN